MWRLQTHETFGGTWLSDFVPNRLGGFIGEPAPEPEKPDCALIGQDGNIFNLVGIAARILREHDLKKQAQEMKDRVFASGSYSEALLYHRRVCQYHGFRSGAGTKAFPPAAAKGNKTGRTGKEPETAKAAGTVRRIGMEKRKNLLLMDNSQWHSKLSRNDFISLFQQNTFEVYENDHGIDMEKDEEYYAWRNRYL